jgi:hypothetical protein
MRSLGPSAFACSLATLVTLVFAGCGGDASSNATEPKSCDYTSTYDAIQETIFEAKSCTAGLCHGEGESGEGLEGGLDLREGASFDALVRQPSQIDPSIDRVHPGDQDLSLLYLKLEAATNGTDLGNRGGQMPVGIEPLSEDQLEAIRLWIRGGAPRDTIVGDTLELLGCEGSYEPDPNKIAPLPAPAEGEGVQFYAGAWELSAESEDEVCFATYYDFSDQVPPESQVDCPELGEGRKCFTFRRNELAQDGQSHHSIIDAYLPESDPNGGDWGPWQCLGGAMNGQACDPTVAGVCGERAQCATPAVTAVACLGYPHAPAGFGVGGGGMTQTSMPLGGAQESVSIDDPPVGVYSALPLKGFISWNSHAFNLTKKDTTIEQWVNLTFAPEPERQWIRRQIFEARNIFAMGPIDPFEKEEICMTWTLPQYAQLLSLSSHMHQRGKLFRIWLPPNTSCGSGVAGCEPPGRDPDYASRFYDDPVYTYYDPPNDYSSADEADRTFLACAVFDNGADNPLEVKRESTKPNTPACDSFRAFCGCDASERACFGGDSQGMLCAGDDAACGEGGMCDACPLLGGVTTDDEMFLPLGSYYVAEP